jgi:hypothetical protein
MPIAELIESMDAENGRTLIEDLAALAHEQWVEWSMNIAFTETLSSECIQRWKPLWTPYSLLTEAYKETGRKKARKVLEVINRNGRN